MKQQSQSQTAEGATFWSLSLHCDLRQKTQYYIFVLINIDLSQSQIGKGMWKENLISCRLTVA